jgi:hypothetical protein
MVDEPMHYPHFKPKLCKNLKDMDDAFEYECSIDENNNLEHIIWAFGDSIRDMKLLEMWLFLIPPIE